MGEIVDRECPVCGSAYVADLQRLARGRGTTCSRECSYTLRASKREDRVAVQCERCGQTFETTPSRLQGGRARFCSRVCQHPPHVFVCQHCGAEFVRPPSSKAKFCSVACDNASEQRSQRSHKAATTAWSNPAARAKLMGGIARRSKDPRWNASPQFQQGPDNPRYTGAERGRPGMGRYPYKLWRNAVLVRDGFQCRECGSREGQLHAHHRVPWNEDHQLRYAVSNGVTLCVDCHNKAHGRHTLPETRKCASCGELFVPSRQARKYCSLRCSGKGAPD